MLSVREGHWGAELGMFGVVGRLHETYAAAVWQRERHKVALGFPQPAYDRYAVSGLIQIMPRLALETIGTTRSRATSGVFTESEFLPYGVAYQTDGLALSLNGVPDTDIVIAGLAGRETSGDWRFDYGVEAVAQNDEIDWNGKAQILRNLGGWDLGAGIYVADANAAAHVAEIFARIPVSDGITATTLLRQTQAADLLAGAKIAYVFDNDMMTDFAVVGTGNDDVSIAVSIGYQF